LEEGSPEVPQVQQKATEAFYEIKVEWNDSTTSYNKNKAITLVSKTENCKELIEIAKQTFDDLS
jgi:hypothetical protein